jgi:hypothetical protein
MVSTSTLYPQLLMNMTAAGERPTNFPMPREAWKLGSHSKGLVGTVQMTQAISWQLIPGLTKIAVPSISFPRAYTLSFNVLSRVNNPGNKSRQRVVQEREPLGRLYRFMLFFSGERYFVQSIVIQDANDKQMQAQIRIVSQVLCYLDETLCRHDPSYVVGQFWIFAAIFLNDGSPVFECQIDLSELGEIISHEVFDFVGGRPSLRRRQV